MNSHEHNDVNRSTDGNDGSGGVSRRNFMVGAAAGAAMASTFATSAHAQEADDKAAASMDWRSVTPGEPDSGLYAETTGYDENTEVTAWSGRQVAVVGAL